MSLGCRRGSFCVRLLPWPGGGPRNGQRIPGWPVSSARHRHFRRRESRAAGACRRAVYQSRRTQAAPHIRTAGRSYCRRRGLSRRGTPPTEIRRASLRPKGQHADGDGAADAGHRERAGRTVDDRPVTVDDVERGARFLFAARRLGAALHPHDAGGLRCVSHSKLPARHLHARPRRYRSRAAVLHQVDDGLHVEAIWCRRRSLHAPALRPLHECEPYRRRDRWPGGDRSRSRRPIPSIATASSWPGFSMGGASAWSYTVHYADRWVAAAPGRRLLGNARFPSQRAGAPAAERRTADVVALVRRDRLRSERIQPPGCRLFGRQRRAEAGRRCHGRRDGGRRPHARAHHRAEYRALV